MRYRIILAVLVAALCLSVAGPAYAEGTGDDPRPSKNKETSDDVSMEAEYQAWLAEQSSEETSTGEEVGVAAVIAPYRYLWTPSHAQERSYWCGPATVQIVDDYFGTPASQYDISKYLRTTRDGTDFTRVDDALRYFTGHYDYTYRTCTSHADFRSRVQYGIKTKGHPCVVDMNVDGSAMNCYVFDHPGHIVPIEAFDWRYGTVRLNDPYDESYYRSHGGSTFGHRTYPVGQISNAVMSHFRHAIVY
ncbi:MAG: C39 family peptidase [Anaerosomatales bacterium]|nr:C39 family peptidase [Anaerosomatales bacterium]